MCKTQPVQKNLPEYFYVLNIEYLEEKLALQFSFLKKSDQIQVILRTEKPINKVCLFIKFKNNEQIHTRK